MTSPINFDIFELILKNSTSLKNKYIKLGGEKQEVLSDSKKLEIKCFVLDVFIAFRLLLICDVCHDFLQIRKNGLTLSDSSSKTRWKHYKELQEFTTVTLIRDFYYMFRNLGNFGNFGSLAEVKTLALSKGYYLLYYAIETYPYISRGDDIFQISESLLFAHCRILNLELSPTENKVEYDKVINRKLVKPNYITSDTDAKKISNNLLLYFFKLISVPTKFLVDCSFKNSAQEMSSIIFILKKYIKIIKQKGKKKFEDYNFPRFNSTVSLNIDAVGSTHELLPYFNDLYQYSLSKECDMPNIDDIVNKSDSLILMSNISNQYDSANDSVLQQYLHKIVGENNIIKDDIDVNLYFFKISIINYTINNFDDPVMSIKKYFKMDKDTTMTTEEIMSESKTKSLRESSQASIQKHITDKMESRTAGGTIPNLSIYMFDTAYKTLGDFSQIIQFCYYYSNNNFDRDTVKSFLTFDHICFNIASILCPNVIGQIYDNQVFNGLSTYIDVDYYNYIKQNPDEYTQLIEKIKEDVIGGAGALLSLTQDRPKFKSAIIKKSKSKIKSNIPSWLPSNYQLIKSNNLSNFGKTKIKTKNIAKSLGIKLSINKKQKGDKILQEQIKLLTRFAKRHNIKLSKNTYKNAQIVQNAINLGIPLKIRKNSKIIRKTIKTLENQTKLLTKFAKKHKINLNKSTYIKAIKLK